MGRPLRLLDAAERLLDMGEEAKGERRAAELQFRGRSRSELLFSGRRGAPIGDGLLARRLFVSDSEPIKQK